MRAAHQGGLSPLLRGRLPRRSLRSSSLSADGALPVAEFDPKSATVELGVCRQIAGPLLAATPASQPWLFPLLMSKIYRDYRSSMSLVPRSAAATRSVDSRLVLQSRLN